MAPFAEKKYKLDDSDDDVKLRKDLAKHKARKSKKRKMRRTSIERAPESTPDLTGETYNEEIDGQELRGPKPSGIVIEFDGLSHPGQGTRERQVESPKQASLRLEKLRRAVSTILECIGEDPEREGILNTPARYAKAMLFFTKGYQQNIYEIVNNAIFHEGHNEMVVVKDIEIFSLCEHHMVPFTGKMHIGYIPKNNVIGISKLPRIAEMFSRRLQVQERLTNQVANAIMEVLEPRGVAVVMESSHLCMVMRGVEKVTATTITHCVLGCFERKKMRDEFFSLVGVNGGSA
ncbi:GTP cyclohydrolase I [Hypoxylon sp. FL1150]|nr:GTP cyclohydrolase I [Hypoxylon sp. FL1150]